jgi:hypothetical protein
MNTKKQENISIFFYQIRKKISLPFTQKKWIDEKKLDKNEWAEMS